EATGVSPTFINGGFDFNGMTQIEARGYMNDPQIRMPRGERPPVPAVSTPCYQPMMLRLTPVVQPKYSLSFDPHACGGRLSAFPSVSFSNWLGPHIVTIYIVEMPALEPMS